MAKTKTTKKKTKPRTIKVTKGAPAIDAVDETIDAPEETTSDVEESQDAALAQDASEASQAAGLLDPAFDPGASGFDGIPAEDDQVETESEEPAPADLMSPTTEDPAQAEFDAAMSSADLALVSETVAVIIMRKRELEDEKAAVVKAYGKRIQKLESRLEDLGEHLQSLTSEEIIDHDKGVAITRSKRSGAVLKTRPLAFSDKQLDLGLDAMPKPEAPPPPAPSADDDAANVTPVEKSKEAIGILRALDLGDMTMAELETDCEVEGLGLSKTRLKQLVEYLVDKEVVRKEPGTPGKNGKPASYAITEAGQIIIAEDDDRVDAEP